LNNDDCRALKSRSGAGIITGSNAVRKEIQNNSDFIENILESLSHPFYVINADTYEIEIANRVTNLKVGEEGPRTCYELTHDANQPCSSISHPCPIEEIKIYKKPLHVEHYHKDKQGNLKVFEIHAHPIVNENGKVDRIIEYSLDITGRKQIEEALRQSEEKYRLLVDSASEGIFVAQDGFLKYFNPKTIQLLKYNDDEMRNIRFLEFVHPADRDMVKEKYDQKLSGERITDSYSFRLLDKNGKILWVEISNILLEWNGRPASLNFIRDITEKVIAERTLKEAELQFKLVLNSLGDAIHVVDSDFNMIILNDYFRNWIDELGFDTDVLGSNLFDIFPFLTEKVKEEYQRVFDTGQIVVTEERTKINGSSIITETKKIPIFQNGRVIQVITVVRDISERKGAEEKLRQSLEEREVLFKELKHRVKNNLQLLSSMVDMQIMRTPGDTTVDKLKEIQSLIETMALIYTKAFEGTKIMGLNLNNFIMELITGLIKFKTNSDLEINYSVSGDNIILSTDRAIPLVLIVNELIFNALKHAFSNRKKGQIDVILKEEENTILIAVKDDGIGMSGDSDMKKPNSLGLKLVRNLTEQLKGNVSSIVNNGTEFIIEIPAKEVKRWI
jgi:PAS domain S-box-containing protein